MCRSSLEVWASEYLKPHAADIPVRENSSPDFRIFTTLLRSTFLRGDLEAGRCFLRDQGQDGAYEPSTLKVVEGGSRASLQLEKK
jgi:hypothetical protein